jgi:hypothetical protein
MKRKVRLNETNQGDGQALVCIEAVLLGDNIAGKLSLQQPLELDRNGGKPVGAARLKRRGRENTQYEDDESKQETGKTHQREDIV